MAEQRTRQRKRAADDSPKSRFTRKRERKPVIPPELAVKKSGKRERAVKAEAKGLMPYQLPADVNSPVPVLWQNPTILDHPEAQAMLKDVALIQTPASRKYKGQIIVSRGLTLTPELMQAICYGLEMGLSLRAVCGHLGVSPDTVNTWIKRGKDNQDGSLQHIFSENIKMARARFEMNQLNIIRMAAQGGEEIKETKTKYLRHEDPETGEVELVAAEKTETIKTRQSNPLAAQWLLERLIPSRYGANILARDDDDEAAEALDDALDAIDEMTDTAIEGTLNADDCAEEA